MGSFRFVVLRCIYMSWYTFCVLSSKTKRTFGMIQCFLRYYFLIKYYFNISFQFECEVILHSLLPAMFFLDLTESSMQAIVIY